MKLKVPIPMLKCGIGTFNFVAKKRCYGASKNKPLTTAFHPPVRVTRNRT